MLFLYKVSSVFKLQHFHIMHSMKFCTFNQYLEEHLFSSPATNASSSRFVNFIINADIFNSFVKKTYKCFNHLFLALIMVVNHLP